MAGRTRRGLGRPACEVSRGVGGRQWMGLVPFQRLERQCGQVEGQMYCAMEIHGHPHTSQVQRLAGMRMPSIIDPSSVQRC